MIALTLLLAQAASSPAAETRPVRLLVALANGTSTTSDYSTIEQCETARDRAVSYNRMKSDEVTKRDKERDGRSYPYIANAICIPL